MQCKAPAISVVMSVTTLFVGTAVLAQDDVPDAGSNFAEQFELTAEDISDITSQVMAKHPLISSSPGVKYAGGSRHRQVHEGADLIYHPHVEIAGVKHAFQVSCSRELPEKSWDCADVRIRRYVAVESQEFEVRVTGSVGSKVALVLIEATRRAIPRFSSEYSTPPSTAVMIRSGCESGGYMVRWGTPEGYARLTFRVQLPEGADPHDPDAWDVKVWWSSDE